MFSNLDLSIDRIPGLVRESLSQLHDEQLSQLGPTLISAVEAADPVTASIFVASTACAGLIQNQSIETSARINKRIVNRLEDLEDEDTKLAAAQVNLLRQVSAALPDHEQWDKAVIQSANGDPEDLIELLEMYADDSDRRDELETTVRNLFAGEVNLTGGETFVEYLCNQFETDDRNEALTTFLDITDLLTARGVHEAVSQLDSIATEVTTVEQGLDNIDTDIEAVEQAVDDARDRIGRLLDRDLRNAGFHRVTDAYVRTRPTKRPAEAWRTGMNLRQVLQDGPNDNQSLAVKRSLILDAGEDDWAPYTVRDGDNPVLEPTAVADGLAEGRNLLIHGKPGSGKSVLSRLVIKEWRQDDERGSVFYRPSGASTFDDPGQLVDAIEHSVGPTLVVVEDAARAETKAVYPVMDDFRRDESVAFLLNGRYGEWTDFEPAESTESDYGRTLSPLMDQIPKARPAPLNGEECGRILSHFEATTDKTVTLPGVDQVDRGAVLFDRIRTESHAGEMLHLTTLLVGGKKLYDDAVEKAAAIETPCEADARTSLRRFNPELVRHTGLMIALLNAADELTVRREYLFGLAAELSEAPAIEGTYAVSDIESLLRDAFDGWLVFDGTATRRYRTYHELWSVMYLRALIEYPNGDVGVSSHTVHERFARCVRAMLAVHIDNLDRRRMERIRRRVADLDRTVFDELDEENPDSLVQFVELVYGIGTQYPILAPLYQPIGSSELRLESWEAIPMKVAITATLATGTMYVKRGELTVAGEAYEHCDTLLTECPNSTRFEGQRLIGLGDVHLSSGRWDEARENYQRAKTAFSRIDAESGRAMALTNLGEVARLKGDFQEARKLYNRSLEVYRTRSDQSGEARCIGNLGILSRVEGDFETAIERHHESLSMARVIGSRQLEAWALANLGNALQAKGKLSEAHDYHTQSLEIARDIGNRSTVARELGNIGTTLRRRGEFERAENQYRNALTIYQKIGDKQGEATCYTNLGELALSQGDLTNAGEHFLQSLEVARNIGDRRRECIALGNYGEVARREGRLDTAENLYDESIGIAREIGDKHGEASNLRGYGVVETMRGNYEKAETFFQRSYKIAKDIADPDAIAKSQFNLGMMLQRQKDHVRAISSLSEAADLLIKIGDKSLAFKTLDALLDSCEQTGDWEIGLEWCSEAIEFGRNNDASTERLDHFEERRRKFRDQRLSG